jgi:hypothetical protein
MRNIIEKLQRELYAKANPGVVLLNLREKWLEKFLTKHKCDQDILLMGFMLADYKLQVATQLRKPQDHIRMSMEYANQIFETYNVDASAKEVITEIVETHHNGKQRFIESKLFRNAEAMALLDPEGFMFNFGNIYSAESTHNEVKTFIQKAVLDAEKRLSIIDLDDETIDGANHLYANLKTFLQT